MGFSASRAVDELLAGSPFVNVMHIPSQNDQNSAMLCEANNPDSVKTHYISACS